MDEEAIRDVFQAVGDPIQIRRMFGGKGVYQGDVMFALVAFGEIYLKADDETVEVFRNLGSRPFAFTHKTGRIMTTSYWLMPGSALEEPEEAARYAALAIGAARRTKLSRTRRVRRGPKDVGPR